MWSNFVKYLNPTPADNVSQDLAGVAWKSVTQDSHEYLRLVHQVSYPYPCHIIFK